jgi:Domain of Unknown Function (DUF1206)
MVLRSMTSPLARRSRASTAVRRGARSPLVGRLGRVGLAAQGCCFLIIGVLALGLAAGVGGKATDPRGAMVALAEHRWTEVLLVLLAGGFACYAIWRLAQALLDRGGMGTGAGGLARRGIQLVQGLTYVALTASAISIVAGAHPRSGGAKRATGGVLGWPGGRELVAAIGFVLVGIAIGNAYWALSGRFMESVHTEELRQRSERVLLVLGRISFLSLAVVFAIVGWFLVKAAIDFDPKDAVSIGGALARLSQLTYGKFLLGIVAAGVFAYGVFGLVQGRYHRA